MPAADSASFSWISPNSEIDLPNALRSLAYWMASWNYYGYGEGGGVGPTLPRAFHGDMFTLSVRHDFAPREGKY